MTCHYHLNFHYMIPDHTTVELIDYNLCKNEICFLFDFQSEQRSSSGLHHYHFTIWVPEEYACRITAISTFALNDGLDHCDEKYTGVRYIQDSIEFDEICQEMFTDPSITDNLRTETGLEEIWDGEQAKMG